jgi:hypothetical protein
MYAHDKIDLVHNGKILYTIYKSSLELLFGREIQVIQPIRQPS